MFGEALFTHQLKTTECLLKLILKSDVQYFQPSSKKKTHYWMIWHVWHYISQYSIVNGGRRTHSECPTVFRSSVWVHFELHRITKKGAWFELSFSKWFHITVIKLVPIIYLILILQLSNPGHISPNTNQCVLQDILLITFYCVLYRLPFKSLGSVRNK